MAELFGIKLTRKSLYSEAYKELTGDQKTEFYKQVIDKLCKRPPTSELQKLAQKENYALFTLMGMRSNLHHVKQLQVFPTTCRAVEKDLDFMIDQIRSGQADRKQKKERECKENG